jgi:hypothetical protein
VAQIQLVARREVLMRNIAVIIDGVWMQPQVQDDNRAINARNDSNVVNSSTSVDQIVAALSQIVVMTQSLPENEDQRRVREFIRITSSMLGATTYLPKQDQRIFERALRDAAAHAKQAKQTTAMREVSFFVNGNQAVQPAAGPAPPKVINPSTSEVDQIVVLLSEVIARAQSLSVGDQSRVRYFVHTTQSVVDATTCLQSRLRKFEQIDKWSFCLTAGTLVPANQERR